jgi:hypothetical protein
MKKTKASTQELKPLDDFEQNTGIVIGILENSLQRIVKWHNDFGKTDQRFIAKRSINDVIKILESFAPFGDAFPQIRRFLNFYIPEYKERVEDGYSNIKNKIREIVHKYGQDPLSVLSDQAKSWEGELYLDMCDLRSYTENLSKDLSYCVRIARERQKPQNKGILRKLWLIIAGIVAFLAALLTCLYYLEWLEPTKVFIYKLFTHN